MKNYSFSNIASEQSYATRKSNDFSNMYRHSQLKSSEANQRIEEIKKKYDTPSRRERIQSLKKSREYEAVGRGGNKEETRESMYQHRQAPTFGNNCLKQSFAVNRLEKSTLKNDYDSKEFMNLRGSEREFRRSNEKENDFGSYVSNNREEEEIIISKVREMKESIINNDYMKTSINGKSSVKLGKYSQFGEAKKEFDPRVENIDKINMKIKHILSSLSENENPKYLKESNSSNYQDPTNNKESAFFGNRTKDIAESKKSYESHFHKNSDVVEKYNLYDPKPAEEQRELTKAVLNDSQKSSKYEPYSSKANLEQKYRNRDYSVNRMESYSKDYSVSRPPKREEELVRTPSYLSKYEIESRGLKASRSKSQIDSFHKSSLAPNENNDLLKSGKKLNDQISKIQRKIEEFEKEKRKLNIDFTPFTLKNKSTANLNVNSKVERQPENPREGSRNNQDSRGSSKYIESSKIIERSSSYDLKFKSYMNRAANYEQKYGEFNHRAKESFSNNDAAKPTSIYDNVKSKLPAQESDFQLKIQQIEVKTVRIDNGLESNEEENINNPKVQFDEAAIKKRTDEGIELRRKKLQGDNDIIKTESLKRLVALFCEQAKLDENFRNLKIWLESCFDTDKFNKIARSLEKEGVRLAPKECEAIFTVDESEHNPFFSVQGCQGSYQSLSAAYLQADRHWKSKLQHKFQKSPLLSQGFSCQKIDLQRKGYIQLQDLVRFLNIQSGTFYRNRDLFLIFHRFTSSQRLNFQSLLGEICA